MTTVIGGVHYTITARERVTGCGSKFDGRMKYTLSRVSDGKLFGWIGSRTSKCVPGNARIVEK